MKLHEYFINDGQIFYLSIVRRNLRMMMRTTDRKFLEEKGGFADGGATSRQDGKTVGSETA
jgi:hypothetical protein